MAVKFWIAWIGLKHWALYVRLKENNSLISKWVSLTILSCILSQLRHFPMLLYLITIVFLVLYSCFYICHICILFGVFFFFFTIVLRCHCCFYRTDHEQYYIVIRCVLYVNFLKTLLDSFSKIGRYFLSAEYFEIGTEFACDSCISQWD